MNEQIILTADTAKTEKPLKTYDSIVVNENNDTVVHEADGENKTVTQMTDDTQSEHGCYRGA